MLLQKYNLEKLREIEREYVKHFEKYSRMCCHFASKITKVADNVIFLEVKYLHNCKVSPEKISQHIVDARIEHHPALLQFQQWDVKVFRKAEVSEPKKTGNDFFEYVGEESTPELMFHGVFE